MKDARDRGDEPQGDDSFRSLHCLEETMAIIVVGLVMVVTAFALWVRRNNQWDVTQDAMSDSWMRDHVYRTGATRAWPD